jgi:rhodanese-like protein
MIVLGVATAGAILWRSGAYHAITGGSAIIGVAMNQETFIDVRTDEEWNAGHIDGALHFDLARMQQGSCPTCRKIRRLPRIAARESGPERRSRYWKRMALRMSAMPEDSPVCRRKA